MTGTNRADDVRANQVRHDRGGLDTNPTHKSHDAPHDELVDELKRRASNVGTELRSMATSTARAAEDEWDYVKGEAKRKASTIQDALADRVRERPLNSLLMAAGLGVFMGIFFFRR